LTEGPEAEVVIGVVAAPFGVRGEVKVHLQTDHPERYYDLDEVDLRTPDGRRTRLKIESVRFHKGAALIKFEGRGSVEAAEELRGGDLVVPKSETVELAEDEFFIHDLIGLCVYGVDGRNLGRIKEVIRGLANDAYVTEKVIVPALRSVVREVDIAGGKMIVDLPWSEEE